MYQDAPFLRLEAVVLGHPEHAGVGVDADLVEPVARGGVMEDLIRVCFLVFFLVDLALFRASESTDLGPFTSVCVLNAHHETGGVLVLDEVVDGELSGVLALLRQDVKSLYGAGEGYIVEVHMVETYSLTLPFAELFDL